VAAQVVLGIQKLAINLEFKRAFGARNESE
jgi:hypothetical protein